MEIFFSMNSFFHTNLFFYFILCNFLFLQVLTNLHCTLIWLIRLDLYLNFFIAIFLLKHTRFCEFLIWFWSAKFKAIFGAKNNASNTTKQNHRPDWTGWRKNFISNFLTLGLSERVRGKWKDKRGTCFNLNSESLNICEKKDFKKCLFLEIKFFLSSFSIAHEKLGESCSTVAYFCFRHAMRDVRS